MAREILRVAALHDLSGVGRCALTVIIPIMSAMGIQVCPVPTAVFSSHSGGFDGFFEKDLTDAVEGSLKHYREMDFRFDGVYTGFLNSPRQFELAKEFIAWAESSAKTVAVDPVFADNGSLYSIATEETVRQMKELIGHATLITPNVTEAMFLLGEEVPETFTEDALKKCLLKLADFGSDVVVMTGVRLKSAPERIAAAAYQKKKNQFAVASRPYVPAEYPGTGDAFASIMTAAAMREMPFEASLELAIQFVYHCAEVAYREGTPVREGLPIEGSLHILKA